MAVKDQRTVERELLNPPAHRTGGTVGDDVMTVHKVRDGKPLCGAVGSVDVWQRRVTCSACLASEWPPDSRPGG
ncbi:hypothetical protein SCWH03_02390 [Streptomyces pacificus]|uniref:Uncharacterized protein n=1 Tax=Streptomyces pacificus TaxID=2705029 RepID=A0A6A0AQA1_9ACTN|nr:hypothetical protein SCWH03_02390 [Streptomyces pacificus]